MAERKAARGPMRARRKTVGHQRDRVRFEIPLIDRLKPIQRELAALSKPGGLPADKTFFDELSDDV